MTLGPQEIVRSEVEGGLSGPSNSLTAESIDCGCGRYQMPRLAKFATRRIFLALLCCIGVLQAAAQAYFYVTSTTIARRFQFDYYLMEWILCVSDITPIVLAIGVAYWGDRIHRAAWLGGLTLIECGAFLFLLIPHISHWSTISTDVNEPDNNITHMSIYAGENPYLCKKMSSRLIAAEDLQQYSTLFILIAVQIVTGMANIAYYALGISYLDDNTKKLRVSVYIGVILAMKLMGSVFGYMIGWGFLRIDADNLVSIQSYKDQIGAWWLGWPIFSFLLAIPATLMAIFPRKLPSEMVEQAAATILDQSGTLRRSQRITEKKVGSTHFLPSMLRLITNKVLIFNGLAGAFFITALINFSANENIFLESRFYDPRPTGMLLGFRHSIISRTIAVVMKPLVVGLTIIIAGLVIARAKPKARTLVIYNFAVLAASALIIFCLAFNNCEKAPTVIAYSGSDCFCIEGAGLGNNNQPCGSCSCKIGWIIYEILTILVYAAASSTMVGDLLISLRSVNAQDKALTIGYSMAVIALFAYVPGKIAYDELAKSTCVHWETNNQTCLLHHRTNLGNYLCFLTAGLIVVSILFKVGLWFFSGDIEIYDPTETETSQPTEMKDMSTTQAEPLLQPRSNSAPDETDETRRIELLQSSLEPIIVVETKKKSKENGPVSNVVDENEPSESRLKYGPLGPGNRRVTQNQSNASIPNASTDDELDSSDGSQVPRKGSASQVSYKPLEIDSDVESELSGTVPRTRKRISSTDMEDATKSMPASRSPFSNMRFPNPDNYEDPRIVRSSRNNSPNIAPDGSSKTNSFEYSKTRKDNKPLPVSASEGDFNEVGIPLVESYEASVKNSSGSLRSPTVMTAIQHLDRNPSRELLQEAYSVYKPVNKVNSEEIEENRKFRLEKLMQPVNYTPSIVRPPSRDQASSGFGSLLDMREKARNPGDISDKDSLSSKSSKSGPPKKGGPVCTDL